MRLFYLISFVLAQDGIDYWDDSPGFLKRSHSLISPFSGNLPLWELKGDSMATSEYIRLTPDQQSKNGAIWSRVVSSRPHIPIVLTIYRRFMIIFSRYLFLGGKSNSVLKSMGVAKVSQPMEWDCFW